jgi:hypothetical protein
LAGAIVCWGGGGDTDWNDMIVRVEWPDCLVIVQLCMGVEKAKLVYGAV